MKKLLLTILIAWSYIAGCSAQDFPSKEIKMVVPLPPGGGTDAITRQLSDRLSKQLGKPIVVDNRGGAGTTIGMAYAATAPADGYTLVTNGDTVAIFELIFNNLKFDTFKDFTPVAYFAYAPLVLVANPKFAPNNARELVALAKQKPGEINYFTPGVGTPHDLAGQLLMHKAGIKFNEITYRGGGPAVSDLMAGHVQIGISTLSTVLPHIQSGRLKAIGILGNARTSLAPEIPSFGEFGIKDVNVQARYVLLAPNATPKAIIGKLNAAVAEVLKRPDTVDAFQKMGYEPMLMTADQSAAMLRAERDLWRPILKASKIQPE